MDTTDTSSLLRKTITTITALLAVLSCPCHLPILLLVLSGTAAGAFLSKNMELAVVILLPIFVLSLFATWRLLETKANDRQ